MEPAHRWSSHTKNPEAKMLREDFFVFIFDYLNS